MALALSKPYFAAIATLANTSTTGTLTAFSIPIADAYTWYLNVATAQTTCDTVFKTSVDGGTTYVSVPWRFAQVTTTTGCFVLNVRTGVGSNYDVTAATGTGILIADTGGALNLQAIVDPFHMQMKYTLTGNSSWTLYVACFTRAGGTGSE